MWGVAHLGESPVRGGVGGCLGMRAFHHKTKHWYFRFGFPLIALLWLALIVWLMSR